MRKEDFLNLAKEISLGLRRAPIHWDGRNSILEMKRAGFSQWKQMEWIGFYFQFLCEELLQNIIEIPGPKYGNVRFDGFKKIPWDFKAHAINTGSHQIIVNDSEATANAIRDYDCVGLILAMGEVEYNDENRTFQKWHEELKGGKSKYELERIKRGAWSRLRKVEFKLEQISFIKIDDEVLVKCGSFQRDFRNAGGQPRREKVLLDLEKLDEEIIYFLDFNKK
ncbi:MAG: hypothetical protein NC898_05100 [Candidatus Omnitrophica bacterium]|nr:hypothetical protein [Candidatus Omnitrophota bacterium]MCM8793820.1 hypothetical protein [Candidatus Omnitrophota bacterium]